MSFWNHYNDFGTSLQCFFEKENKGLPKRSELLIENSQFGRFKDLKHLLFARQTDSLA
jgi:hypothetical protein